MSAHANACHAHHCGPPVSGHPFTILIMLRYRAPYVLTQKIIG